jgi:uncharacterized repeat protein (TIGR03803 family)
VKSKKLISTLGVILGLLYLSSGAGSAWAASEKVLHSFAFATRGAHPYAPLLLDSAGNLYGTSTRGGAHGYGAVFELVPKGGGWTESVLYSFIGSKDGNNANGNENGLVVDSAGNLYGTNAGDNSVPCGPPPQCGTVFELTPNSSGGWSESIIYTFKGGNDGSLPKGRLVFDRAGNLYGVTSAEGGMGGGTVFKLTPNSGGGWTESILYTFSSAEGNGPEAGLVFDSAGNLYGTTGFGPRSGGVYKLTPNSGGGWTESVLYTFTGGADGARPYSSLIFDQGGNLYGTTTFGGNSSCGIYGGCGTVFKLTPNSGGGWTESVIYSFTGGNDQYPGNGVIFDSAGNLYGTTVGVQIEDIDPKACQYCGTVFELTPTSNGWTKTVLHTFTAQEGGNPFASLIFDRNGDLLGSAPAEGPGRLGVVFQLTPTSAGWTESSLHNFRAFDGTNWNADFSEGLVSDAAGNLFGTTSFGGTYNEGTVYEMVPGSSGWTEKVLYNFTGRKDGGNPLGGLVFDAAGSLYGTGNIGGAHYSRKYAKCRTNFLLSTSCGVVFKLTPTAQGTWSESVIYSFCAKVVCQDGRNPIAGPTIDKSGNLYVAAGGGYNGYGAVFELMPSTKGWTEKVVYNFCGKCGEGYAQGPFAFDQAGNLYGFNSGGGGQSNCGLVIELMPRSSGWTASILHTFAGGKDGAGPFGRPIFDSAGNLYGSTGGGGAGFSGTVFELTPNSNGGWTENILYSFTGGADGGGAYGTLVFDSAGDLFGTAAVGGNVSDCGGYGGCGTVFKLTPDSGGWTESVLYSFMGGADGFQPRGGLVFDSAGNLVGSSAGGGAHNAGTVFEVTP